MKHLIPTLALFISLVIFIHSCQTTPTTFKSYIQDLDSAPEIRILIKKLKDSDALQMETRGLVTITSNNRTTPLRMLNNNELKIELSGNKVSVNGKEFNLPLKLKNNDNFFTYKDNTYDGYFIIQRHKKTSLLINYVNLESYLYSVVFHEIGTLAGEEGIKAQAIASRSYTYSSLFYDRTKQPYDFYTDERSQVYKGINKIPELILKAVNKTTGMILFENDDIVYSFYSSTCGGVTQSANNLFSVRPSIDSLKGVRCGYCTNSPHFYWKTSAKKSELENKVGNFNSIELKYFSQNKPHASEIIFKNNGSAKAYNLYKEFRNLVGKNIIKSPILRSAQISGETVFFEGNGLGHSIGLCQWGTIEMSSLGYSYSSILAHYFPGATVEKVY